MCMYVSTCALHHYMVLFKKVTLAIYAVVKEWLLFLLFLLCFRSFIFKLSLNRRLLFVICYIALNLCSPWIQYSHFSDAHLYPHLPFWYEIQYLQLGPSLLWQNHEKTSSFTEHQIAWPMSYMYDFVFFLSPTRFYWRRNHKWAQCFSLFWSNQFWLLI